MKMDQANAVLGAAKRSKRCIMAARCFSSVGSPVTSTSPVASFSAMAPVCSAAPGGVAFHPLQTTPINLSTVPTSLMMRSIAPANATKVLYRSPCPESHRVVSAVSATAAMHMVRCAGSIDGKASGILPSCHAICSPPALMLGGTTDCAPVDLNSQISTPCSLAIRGSALQEGGSLYLNVLIAAHVTSRCERGLPGRPYAGRLANSTSAAATVSSQSKS